MNIEKNNCNIKSIVKAFAIIELMASNKGIMSLSQISRELNMARSTIHGYAATLMNLGYLKVDQDSGHYELSAKFFELGYAIFENWVGMDVAKETVIKLSQKLDETVHITRLVDGDILCIFKRETPSSISKDFSIGEKVPLHCTSSGKCLLAYLGPNDIKSLIKRTQLTKYTNNTITDPQLLLEELDKVKKQGYSIGNAEYVDNLIGISCPIFNSNNDVITAITIVVTKNKVCDEYLEKLKFELASAAKTISSQLSSASS